VDVALLDELLQVDGARRGRDERLEVVGVDQHVAPLGHLVALDDVLVGHLFAGLVGHLAIADAAHRALVELVERDALVAHRVEQLDRDRDQPEADGATPDRSGHATTLYDRTTVRAWGCQTASTDARERAPASERP